MKNWSMTKTAKVTNPRNVLIQIPGIVISKWSLLKGDLLEVQYNEEANTVTIRPAIRPRGGAAEESQRMA